MPPDVAPLAHSPAPDVLVDALNVAYWCGDPPSLRIPLCLMAQLIAGGHPALLYFDASARSRLTAETDVYEQLMRYPERFIEVPEGRTADEAMLRRATSSGACIISKDKFRDYRRRYRKLIKNPARVMTGHVDAGHLFVPALALSAELAASTAAAWDALLPLLQ